MNVRIPVNGAMFTHPAANYLIRQLGMLDAKPCVGRCGIFLLPKTALASRLDTSGHDFNCGCDFDLRIS